MARETNRHTSRRRAAALKFLSNISFECSPKDHSSLDYLENVEVLSGSSEVCCDVVNEIMVSKNISTQGCRSAAIFTRERSNTTDLREFRSRREKQKIPEEFSFPISHSSSESIVSNVGCSKQKIDYNSKFQKLKEVKVIRASNLRSCKNERIMLVSPETKTPFYVFSLIPYKRIKSKNEFKKEPNSGRRRNIRTLSGSRPLTTFMDSLDPFQLLGLDKYHHAQMISYQQLLFPESSVCDDKEASCQLLDSQFTDPSYSKNTHISRCVSVDLGMSNKPPALISLSPPFLESKEWDEISHLGPDSYSPFSLDDPELMSGKHRTVLTFPSYRASIIDYVRPSDLKKELNEKFREKFPHTQLTLSKLRSLKRDMKKLCKHEKCVDLLTVAQAYVYFEKLILRNVIDKTNRKLCAAVCLLLSAKMNDTKGIALKQLLEKLESVFRLSRKDVFALEFAVIVALEFSLHIPTWEILPHYQRLVYES